MFHESQLVNLWDSPASAPTLDGGSDTPFNVTEPKITHRVVLGGDTIGSV